MTDCLVDLFFQNCPFDSEFAFRECRPSDKILTKFAPADWHRIVSWIHSQEELTTYARELPYSMATLVYISKKNNTPFCFIMLLRDCSKDDNIVSFHGGGWGSPFISFRCGRDLLKALSYCGFKIRTTIKQDNRKAQRFVEALGMRKATRKGEIYWYRYHGANFRQGRRKVGTVNHHHQVDKR